MNRVYISLGLIVIALVIIPFLFPRTDGFQSLSPADADAPYTHAVPSVYVSGDMSMGSYGSKFLACRSPNPASGTSCAEGTFCEPTTSTCQRISTVGTSDPVGYFS
jgi:hypothetical protein